MGVAWTTAEAANCRIVRASRAWNLRGSVLVPGIKAGFDMNCNLLLVAGLLVGAVAPVAAKDAPLLEYLVETTGGAKADARLPMVIAIHGLGDRPEAFKRLFTRFPGQVRLIVPRAPLPYGKGTSWFRIERPPGAKMLGDMRSSTARLARLIEVVTRRYPTRGKPVVTGFSQGGMLSFALAVAHPKLIAGAVPVAGMLPRAMWPKVGPVAPIRAVHGTADNRVPYAAAEATVVHLLDLKGDVGLQPFVGVKHRVPGVVRAAAFEAILGFVRGGD